MFAAVDLGSNSFRLHIGKQDGDTMRIVKSTRDPIRLASGLDSRGYLTEQAMQTALASLTQFSEILNAYPLDAVRVVATNTMRIARNAKVFLPAAEKAIQHPIEIISGEEEGRLIYMGVSSVLGMPTERRLVLDIGGGSTELILGVGQEIESVDSFGIGTVNQTQLFFKEGRIDAKTFEAAILSARSTFEDAASTYDAQHWSNAYGSSGTIRAIADVVAKNALGDGTLSLPSLHALKEHFVEAGHISRINLVSMRPDRAAVMVGGLAVLIGLMQELNIQSVSPISAGLRMGVLWDLQLRATKRDRRDQSVREFMRRFHVDEKRAARAAEIAKAFFAMLKPAADAHACYLHWSALLHEAGLIVSHSGYHKHGAYLIDNGDLPGFTTGEQRIMSTLILSQKGNLRKVSDELADLDSSKAILALRLAVIFLHSKTDLNMGSLKLKMKNRVELEIQRDWLERHPTISYWLEKEREWWGQVGMDFVIKQID
jgi:exopolyphosphatase/guanosine-5'-triphosphate,3'-diphosphate pyrophosphatase